MIESEFQHQLRKQILSLCKMDSINNQNCRIISIKIFEKDKNYISEASIQNFFDLFTISQTPSNFVFNSLSQFVGFKHWDDFKQKTNRLTA